MASKVLVKLPAVPFPQGKKVPELMTLPAKNEGTTQIRAHLETQTVNDDRTAQLEQNMKFLQDQHKATLEALHQEVETLRQQNRDLQFQLVFTKSTNCVQSSPSSPEDQSHWFLKTKGSPLCVNVTPLQVELLEKDLDEIRAAFDDVKKHNQYLLEVIDKQNKQKAQPPERRKEKSEMTDVGVQVGDTSDPTTNDLTARLEDAEALVKRLRKENEDQQKELATIKAAPTTSSGNRNGTGRSRGQDNGQHKNRGGHGSGGGQGSDFHKFPPLQTQSCWHVVGRGNNHSFDHNPDYHRNGRRRPDKQQQQQPEREGMVDGTVLPQLRHSNPKCDSTSYQPFYRSRGYHDNGGGYYSERGNRKYRGQRSQRDSAESQDHRGYYKGGNKDQQQQRARDSTTNYP